MTKRKASLFLEEGYIGDSENTDECSAVNDVLSDDDTKWCLARASPFFDIPRRQLFRKSKKTKKRKQKDLQSNPASKLKLESPKHPDIDPSLTRHIPSHQFRKNAVTGKITPKIVPLFLEKQPAFGILERLFNQKCETQIQSEDKSTGKGDNTSIDKRGDLGNLPLISCQNMRLEDALSFTHCPRILIQADDPYNIVHTNAAYIDMKERRGKDNKNSLHEQQVDGTFATITSLFGPFQKVTIYPVWREEISHHRMCSPTLTHFLFEVKDERKQSSNNHKRTGEECQTQVIG